MRIKRRPLTLVVWFRIALILLLFAATLYPLGAEETSLGWRVAKVLHSFTAYAPLFLFAVVLSSYTLYWLELSSPLQRGISALWEKMKARPLMTVFFLGLIFFFTACALNYVIYGFLPRIPDSVAQYVHAKIIASGKLLGDPMPFTEPFKTLCMIIQPFTISHYMPLHAILQSLGHILHVPWIINPLLGGVSVGLIYLLAHETHGKATALLACLLACISPYLLLMSAEFMNHATSLMIASLFYLAFVRTVKYRRMRDGALAGLCLGLMLMTRTFTAIMLAYPAAMYVLCWLAGPQRRSLFKAFVPCALLALAFIPVVMQFNILTTGNPLIFSNQITQGQDNTVGFGPVPADIRGWVGADVHTFWRGTLYASNNLLGLNFFILRWPLPALIFIALLFLLRNRNEWNLMFLTFSLCMLMGHMLYYAQDWCFGPRYLYETAPLLLIMTAAGIRRIPVYMKFLTGYVPSTQNLRFFLLMIVLLGVVTAGVSIKPENNIDGCTVAHRNLYHKALERNMKNVLLLVPDLEYITAAAAQPPRDTNDIIVVRDLENWNQFVVDYYPQRDVYRVSREGKFILLRQGNPKAINPPRVKDK